MTQSDMTQGDGGDNRNDGGNRADGSPAGSGAPAPGRPEPALNVPGVVIAALLLFVGIHIYRVYFLSPQEDYLFVFAYAFFPARADPYIFAHHSAAFPGGLFGIAASFVTYGLLHADWTHLVVNGLWMTIFGSALARRFGALRFVLISIIGAVAGAIAHLLSNWGDATPMVGASAAISAHMACAARFAFVSYGPLGRPRSTHPGAYFLPALSVAGMMRNAQAMSFIGMWFVLNLIFGIGTGAFEGAGSIAWQAHIGGFLAGLLLFPVLDPAGKSTLPA